MLVPYKRYDRESIEAVIEDNRAAGVSADETTIARWRRWFSGLAQHIYGALQAACHRLDRTFAESADLLSQSLLQRIHELVGSASGWLGRVVRIMVLENLWVQTRSAFLTG